jgi:xylulokinase
VRERASAITGLPAGAPVMAGCSDTAAEALACGAVAPAQGVIKLATAGNLNVVSAAPLRSPDYYCYSHPVEGIVYHSYGTNSAAASREWLQPLLGAEDYEQLDREAAGVPAGADGVLFHPYLYGERAPVFDGSLRASFLGLRGSHGRAHLLRAVLEGVSLSLAECAQASQAAGLALEELRVIGGGARSALWRAIVADVLGRPLLVPVLDDASAGAALLAGVGAEIFRDPMEAADKHAGVSARVEPDSTHAPIYRELLEVYREARELVAPVSRRLSELSA